MLLCPVKRDCGGWQTSDEPLRLEGKLLLGHGHRKDGRVAGRQIERKTAHERGARDR